jgi:hypothetical protein
LPAELQRRRRTVLLVAPGRHRRAGIGGRIGVVAVCRARRAVSIRVVRAAVGAVAVLIDSVAEDFLRLRVDARFIVVAVRACGVTIMIGVAVVDAVAVLIFPVAKDFEGLRVTARVMIVAVGGGETPSWSSSGGQ